MVGLGLHIDGRPASDARATCGAGSDRLDIWLGTCCVPLHADERKSRIKNLAEQFGVRSSSNKHDEPVFSAIVEPVN